MSRRLKEHILNLAKYAKVKIKWCESWHDAHFESGPYGKKMTVTIPHYKTPKDYFAALHELGHAYLHASLCKEPDNILEFTHLEWHMYFTQRLLFFHNIALQELFDFSVFLHKISCEFAAWQWAIQNALIYPNSAVRNQIRSVLRGYWRELDHKVLKKTDECWEKLGI